MRKYNKLDIVNLTMVEKTKISHQENIVTLILYNILLRINENLGKYRPCVLAVQVTDEPVILFVTFVFPSKQKLRK